MKKILFLLFLLASFCSKNILAQSDSIYQRLDVIAEFPGGENAMMAFLGENIRYPNEAMSQGIEGMVYVEFVVNTDGSLTNFKTLRDIGGGCADEVIRVLKIMPPFKPGEVKGKKVRSYFTQPIHFEVPEENKKNIKEEIE